MPATATDRRALTSLETYALSGQRHGLIVFKIAGLGNEPVDTLARLLSEQELHRRPGQSAPIACRLWIGTMAPTPRADWFHVEAQLTVCSPVPEPKHSLRRDYKAFQIGGFLAEPGRRTDQYAVSFWGRFIVVFGPGLSVTEGEAGYIKLSHIG